MICLFGIFYIFREGKMSLLTKLIILTFIESMTEFVHIQKYTW
jgi:hypothetical protein